MRLQIHRSYKLLQEFSLNCWMIHLFVNLFSNNQTKQIMKMFQSHERDDPRRNQIKNTSSYFQKARNQPVQLNSANQSVKDVQNEHFKATLINVIAGFLILVIIVCVFYGLIQYDKNHPSAPSANSSISANSSSNILGSPNTNSPASNIQGKIDPNDQKSPLGFLDTINDIIGVQAHFNQINSHSKQNAQISHSSQKFIHMRKNQN